MIASADVKVGPQVSKMCNLDSLMFTCDNGDARRKITNILSMEKETSLGVESKALMLRSDRLKAIYKELPRCPLHSPKLSWIKMP